MLHDLLEPRAFLLLRSAIWPALAVCCLRPAWTGPALGGLAVGALAVGCAGPARGDTSSAELPVDETGRSLPPTEPVEYSFARTDGELIGASALRGRTTVLLFVTTFDLGSQVEAAQLNQLLQREQPRINALAVVLEPPQSIDLARSFGEILQLRYPVAMADPATLDGRGPFGRVKTVPTWVVLDEKGIIRGFAFGRLEEAQLEEFVDLAQP